jgi:uncharacterized repeat protein (TIGR03803 family)
MLLLADMNTLPMAYGTNLMKRIALLFLTLSIGPSGAALSAAPMLTTLVSFDGSNGSGPQAELILDAAGNLYGTTGYRGPSDYGTIFRIAAGTNVLTTLASFDGSNGAYPYSHLIADAAGNLYGTTSQGGPALNAGTVFRLAAGTNVLTTLASFNGSNGAYPYAGLIADAAGNLYGTTSEGGPWNAGNVFRVAARTNVLTTLAWFNGSNGEKPMAELIADAAGNLYGTTSWGGAYNSGSVFRVESGTNALTTLASFEGAHGNNYLPYAALIADAAGNLYSTTPEGVNSEGTVFRVTVGTNTLTTLATFHFKDSNGIAPYSRLIADAAGNLYGTTVYGGPSGHGTIFRVDAQTNTLTTLASFDGANGSRSYAGLIADAAGNLYGTTSEGGAFDRGTVFRLSGAGFVVVPEPASCFLAALAASGLAMLRARRSV